MFQMSSRGSCTFGECSFTLKTDPLFYVIEWADHLNDMTLQLKPMSKGVARI